MKINSIYKEIWINVLVEKVFVFFINVEFMLVWYGKEVEVNLVLGGIYKVIFVDGIIILGEYKEVSFYSRVIYFVNYNGVDSLIIIDFFFRDGGILIKL